MAVRRVRAHRALAIHYRAAGVPDARHEVLGESALPGGSIHLRHRPCGRHDRDARDNQTLANAKPPPTETRFLPKPVPFPA